MGIPTIIQTATRVPPHPLDQASVKRAVREVLRLPPGRLGAVMDLFDNALVDRRWSVLPIERVTERRSLGESMALYREHAVGLAREVATECLARAALPASAVDLIITLSCTGYMVPSLDAYLANDLSFRADVRRLPVTELGCVAGAAGLCRARDFLLGYPDAHVLVVAVELPTLSFQHEDLSTAQLVSTALFGDGAAAALLTGRPDRGVSILETRSHLFPNSLQALGFDLRDDGFHVLLAKELPAMLRGEMARIVDELLASSGLCRRDLGSYLLHPGGRRILGALEDALTLDRSLTQPSWDVLREYGNLSSAAVLFVLDRWITRHRPAAGTHGLFGAFGPGLSTELGLLRWN